MKFLLPVILFFIIMPPCHAEIHQCPDAAGNIIYQDSECGSEGIRAHNDTSAVRNQAERAAKNTFIDDGKPGRLIFLDNGKLRPPYTIKVHEVRVITETEDSLVVDVIYSYAHEIPPDEIRIFVLPNHGYWATNYSKAARGRNVARATIGLSRSNMNKDHVRRSFTNTLRITFDHYSPKKYHGSIWSELVRYEKNWTLKP